MKTMLNIKTDINLKKQAQDTAARLGLPLSAVINNYLRSFISVKQVMFSEPLVPSAKLVRRLEETDKDIKAGKNISPLFTNAIDAIAYLNNLK